LLGGRRFLVPHDLDDLVPEVLRHRLLLTYDALAAGVQVDDVVERIRAAIEPPRVAPHQDAAARPPVIPMADETVEDEAPAYLDESDLPAEGEATA
jgi:MoxR-like ATPase